MLQLEDEQRVWRSAETTEFTVLYTDSHNTMRKHYPDFFVDNYLVVEVKPKSMHKDKDVMLKSAAMRELCAKRGYEYQIIAPKRINKIRLRELLNVGKVKMEPRYRAAIRRYLNKNIKKK